MALGSLGSAFTASANHSPNSANGSSAAVKSPDVKGAGCLMEVVSVIWSPKLPLPAARSALQPCMRSALYRAWGRFGLSSVRPVGTIMIMALIGIEAGGCSFSRGGGGWAALGGDEVTGSVSPAKAGPPVPSETDLAFARNAASDVLTKGDKDASQPWA